MIGQLAYALAVVAPQNVPPVRVGAWTVAPIGADACHAAAQFGEHVVVSISEDGAGEGHFILGDNRWYLKDGAVKAATISWDGWKTSREISFTAADVGGTWSLVAETGSWFTENLAESKRFWLRVPGVDFDDDFNIADATEVLTAIAACNEGL